MTASENIRHELEETEARIEDLREMLYRVDADFRVVRAHVGWLRALRVRALKAGIGRQIRDLELRREAARRCLWESRRYEEWLQRSGRTEETRRTPAGC